MSPFFLFILVGSKPVGGMKRSHRARLAGFPGAAGDHRPPAPPTPRSATLPTVMPSGRGCSGAHPRPRCRRRLKLAPLSRLLSAASAELVTKMLFSAAAQSHRQPTSCLSPLTSGVSGSGTAARAGAGSFGPGGGACAITLRALRLPYHGCAVGENC